MPFSLPSFDFFLGLLSTGLLDAAWWQILLFALALTHVTIASVTIYLHRHQAHRALQLHPIAAHAFRFWLWLTTAQVTKEWVAVHRKHHARCDQLEDPHSPHVHGIRKVLLQGAELYRAETKNIQTLERFGKNTPDDWVERNIYTGRNHVGIILMLGVDLVLFGAAGLAVWAFQMAWIPLTAAGIINGLAHWVGYRNFEVSDASVNISPWGILIGGEELHNNHHTYPTSAKLSVRKGEFDIGWFYIQALQAIGLARVSRIPPRMAIGMARDLADAATLKALIEHRHEVMAGYAKTVKKVVRNEMVRAAAEGRLAHARSHLRVASSWLHRDESRVPAHIRHLLDEALAAFPNLAKLASMREELRGLWSRTNATGEQLVKDLQAWCSKADASGVEALREFARMVTSVKQQPGSFATGAGGAGLSPS